MARIHQARAEPRRTKTTDAWQIEQGAHVWTVVDALVRQIGEQ